MHCCMNELAYGCLFCRTGREKATAAELEKSFPDIETIVPVKSRYCRHHGVATEEQVLLFPGYIFFRVQPDYDVFRMTKHNDIYLLLKSETDDWQLYGNDKSIVEKLFEIKGVIGFSKAYFEGEKIRIMDGYLKAYEGQIIRVNRRAKTAQIRVRLHEKEILLWLGYEEIGQIISTVETGREANA